MLDSASDLVKRESHRIIKTFTFLLSVLMGMGLEFILRIVFPGHYIFIVPQLLIFLAVINLNSKNIFGQFLLAVLMYDVWSSQSLGVITVSLVVVFLLIHFFNQIFYLGGRKARVGQVGWSISVAILFSTIIFLIYHTTTHYLQFLFIKWQAGYVVLSWRFLSWPVLFSAAVYSLVVFLFLYLGRDYLRKYVLHN